MKCQQQHLRVALIILGSIILISNAAPQSATLDWGSLLGKWSNQVQEACRNQTGSEQSWEKLVSIAAEIPSCVMRKFNYTSYLVDALNLNADTRIDFFDKYCPQLNDTITCFTPVFNEFRKCYSESQQVALNIVFQQLVPTVNLFCKDHGDIFFENNEKIPPCPTLQASVEACMSNISQDTDAVDMSNYGSKECGEIVELYDCFKDAFVECRMPRFMEFIDLYLIPTVQASPCKDLVKIGGTGSAP